VQHINKSTQNNYTSYNTTWIPIKPRDYIHVRW